MSGRERRQLFDLVNVTPRSRQAHRRAEVRFEPGKFKEQYETALVDQQEARRHTDHPERSGPAARM
jgi:hypothetical protein